MQEDNAFVGGVVPCADVRTGDGLPLAAYRHLQVAALTGKIVHFQQPLASLIALVGEAQLGSVVHAAHILLAVVRVGLHTSTATTLCLLGLEDVLCADTHLGRDGTGGRKGGRTTKGRAGRTVVDIAEAQILCCFRQPGRMAEALRVHVIVSMESVGNKPLLVFARAKLLDIQSGIAHQNALETLVIAISVLAHTHDAVTVAESTSGISDNLVSIGFVLCFAVMSIQQHGGTEHRALIVGRSPCVAVSDAAVVGVQHDAV